MIDQSARCLEHGHYSWAGTWKNVKKDIYRQLITSPGNTDPEYGFKPKLSAFLRPEIQSLFLYRLSHYFHISGWQRSGRAISRVNFILHKVNITPQSCIGSGCRLPHPPGVIFHGQAGCELTLFSLAVCCTSEDCIEGPITNGPNLGDRVLVGAHAVLLGPIEVGSDTKIPYSVRLSSNAPPGVIVMSRNLRLRYLHSSSDGVSG